MSYPPGPNPSYGNGPYGSYPTQSQNYGYPQQQPGYGYPQQPPAPYGPQGPRNSGGMPGKAVAARIMMIVGGSVQTFVMLLALVGLIFAFNTVEDLTDDARLGMNVFYILVGFFLIIGVAGITLGIQFPKGGNVMRVMSIVWASLILISGLIAITTIGVLWVALGVVVIAMLCQPETVAWFRSAGS